MFLTFAIGVFSCEQRVIGLLVKLREGCVWGYHDCQHSTLRSAGGVGWKQCDPAIV